MKFFPLFFLFLNLVFGNVYSQWQQTNGPTGGNIRCFTSMGKTIFAGTSGGIFSSPNNGNDWKNRSNGINIKDVYCITSGGSYLYAGTWGGGLYMSVDSGISWKQWEVPAFYVYSIAVSGDTIYAGTSGNGVFMSPDKGDHWIEVNNGLTTLNIKCLEVKGKTLFAGTQDAGVFTSSDNGKNWKARNDGLIYPTIEKFAIAGDTIFCASYNALNGVCMSTDNGEHWSNLNKGLGYEVSDLTIKGSTIFVTTYKGVYMSIDRGIHWQSSNHGMENRLVNSVFRYNDLLFAGTFGRGVYVSSDNGQNWIEKNSGLLASEVTSMVVRGDTLFSGTWRNGIYASSDNGESWKVVDSSLINTYIRSMCLYKDVILTGALNGILKLSKNNEVWKTVPIGLENESVWSMATIGNKIFAGTENGLFISPDMGNTWPEGNANFIGKHVLSLAVNKNYIFAGTRENGGYFSIDSGITWKPLINGLNGDGILCLAVKGDRVYAGTRSGLYISNDNGQTWPSENISLQGRIISSIMVSDLSIIVQDYYNAVCISVDGGKSWNTANTGMEAINVYSFCKNSFGFFAGTIGGGVRRIPNGAFTPVISGNISGETNICKVLKNVTYSIDDGFWVNSYQWILPAGASGTSTSSKILVNFDSTFISGEIKVKAQNDFGESQELRLSISKVNNCNATAVSEKSFPGNVKVYPNPTTGYLTIANNSPANEDVHVEIFNICGNQLFPVIQKRNDVIQIDLSGYSNGIYFFRICQNNELHTIKVIKN